MVNKKSLKCVVLFSGGLDSRLVVKIMEKQGFEIVPIFFNLPFGCGCCNAMGCSFNFSQLQEIKLEVFDCNKGKLFKEYMEVLKKGEHGRGAGVNPCRDCKIFMLKHAKKFAKDKGIDIIVTGEVLGERPMSQMKSSMDLIERKAGLSGKVLRPLSAKLLPSTIFEESGLVDRSKLYDIHGRRREKQMALAKKFKIKYPDPAGGCLLCEKFYKNRFNFLFERGLDEKELPLVFIGRHFVIDKKWVVLGRNEKENKIIENMKVGKVISSDDLGLTSGSAIIADKSSKKVEEKVEKLITAYSKGKNVKERDKFQKYLL